MNTINIHKLTKHYGKIVALNQVSLKISCSEIFGLIGPNGAGKTTLIKILAGLKRPTEGTVSILGLEPFQNPLEVKRITSVILDEPVFLENLKVKEFIHLMCKIYDVSDNSIINSLIKRWGLDKQYDKQLRFLSHGNRRKVSIVTALIRPFEVIIMDEPFNELDIEARMLLTDEIKNMQTNGKTILITSHEMATIEKFCTRVGILKNGKLLAVLKMEKIKEIIQNTEEFENFEDFVSALLYKKA